MIGPLLAKRLEWEAANPRPAQIRRAEEAIVKALAAAGFGTQSQVTGYDRFMIAVDDLVISVEWQGVQEVRVDGRAPCPVCGRAYREHPMDEVHVSGIDGEPYLHIACDGRRLKT